MCMTGSVYAEYEEVIRRPRLKRSEENIAATLESIRHSALWVRPTQQVTGNIRHFPISWEGTKIITPRGLLDQFNRITDQQTP